VLQSADEVHAHTRDIRKAVRGKKCGRKFAFLRYTAIGSLLATTVVITSFAGVSRAAISIDTMQFPLLTLDTSGVVGYDINDSTSIARVSSQPNISAAVMTDSRKVFIANATLVTKLNADGTLDAGFAEVGYVNGFTNVTALAIDERSDRLYLLDAGESSDPTVVVMTLTGDVLTTTSVPGAGHLISGFGSVITFGATVADAIVWTNDMATQIPLNLDVMIDASTQVTEVIAAPPVSLDDLTEETLISVVIAQQATQTLQRFVIVNPMSDAPTLTEHSVPGSLPVPDVTALAMAADETLFVALGGPRVGEVIRILPDNEIIDEPVVRHVVSVGALSVASSASNASLVIEEESQVVSPSMLVANVSCTPATSSAGRYTLQKFTNTDAACEFDSLPDTVTAIDVLAVGGGGGGGAGQSADTSTGGGGGGAAQLVTNIAANPSSSWLVDVGAGGALGGGSCCGGNEQSGEPGENTVFGDIVVNGGQGSLRQGLGGTAGAGGTANVGGVAGGIGGTRNRGAGGVGNYFNITGSSVCYGAGGGGGANSNSFTGGSGGCGVASSTGQFYRGTAGGNALADGISAQNATNLSHFGGDIYRGHGGGGASGAGSGGAGGPGVVYVRYAALPVITGPVAVTQEATKNATFSVTATAGTATTNQMTYQWRKGGQNIAGATSSTLTVTAIDMDDAGLYDVIVTNDDGAGKTSSSTSVTASLTVEPRSFNFKIGSLTVSTTDRQAFEVASYTGDDRGGMAISSNKAFLVGDLNLAGFDKSVTSGTLASTTVTRPLFTQADSIVSDVKAQRAYVFNRGNTTNCGAVASPCFTKLTELNASTGAMTATEIQLSSPIPYSTSSGDYYAGYGRVVYRNGGTGVVYDVDLPSGDVTVAGTRAISPRVSENFGQAWGVAEFFDGDLWLAYAVTGFIRRTNVRTGATQDIVVCNCADLASFVVDPSLNRWYFHWEGNSSSFNFGSDETFGYASATFETLPAVSIAPASSLLSATSTTFTVQFDDAVTGIAADDFSLSGTSTGWAVTNVTANSASRYTVAVTQTNGTSGTLILSLRSGAASWTAGGGTAIPSSTVSSSAVTVDQTAPTANFTTVPANFLSSAASTFTLTFSEAISGLTASDFSNAGTAQNCVFAPASSTGTTINVSVSGCGDGSLELRLAANSVTDAAGNTGPTAAVTAASRFVDATPGAPVMSFTHSNGTLTNSSTLTFTLTANEPITGLTASDISNVGTAQNCNISVTGTQPGRNFTVTVTNCGGGTVMLRLARDSVSDVAGNTGPTSSGVSVNTVVSTITGIGTSMYSVVHPDGTKLYAVDEGGLVRVFNLANNTQITTVGVGSTPRGITITPNGAAVYVANHSSNTVSKISTATNTVIATISVSGNPHGLAATPDGTKIIVANHNGNSLSVINTATDAVATTISLGRAPWNVKVSPDSRFAYTSNVNNNTISVADLQSNTATTHINVGANPYELGINRSGTRVYSANYSSNSVSIIDTTTNLVIHTLAGFSGPMGVEVSSDDQTVYVNDYNANRVKWFNASTYALNAGAIATGSYPWGMTMSPDGTRGFASNRSGSSVTVFSAAGEVQTTALTVDQAVPTATFSTVPAGPLSSAASIFTLTFSEAISGLVAGDFSNAGTAENCVFAPASSSGIVINVTVSGCGDGTLELQLAANSVTDAAGNIGPATAVTAASRYVDGFPGIPTLSFSAQSNRASNATILIYTLTANEPVSGLTASDITNVGTAQNCDISVSGSQPGTSFTVTAADCGDGTVILRLARDSVVDRAGLAGPNANVSVRHSTVTSFTSLGSTFNSAPAPDGTKVFFTVNSTHRVRIYDTATRTLSATQFVTGTNPRGIAISPDGQTLYVANYSSNTVSVLNASTGAQITTIPVGANPNGIALSLDGTRLVVANLSGNSVSVIDTSSNTVLGTVALGRAPWSVRISANGQMAYTGNYTNSTVSVINVATLTKITDIAVQANPYEIELNRDDSRLYVANYGSHTVSVINTSNNTVIRTVSGVFNGPMGITVSPDNQTVYVANYGSNQVRWFDASTYAAAAGTMAIGSSLARSMTMSPDGTFGFVNTEGGGFHVFHTEGQADSVVHILDRTPPTPAFSTVPPGPLSSGSSVFTLSFTESITGLTASDFTNAGNALNCVFTPASSSGTVINVTVSGCGDGTLELQLTEDSVVDVAGNTGPATAVTAASRYVDGTPGAPVMTFTHSNGAITNSSRLTYTLTSNEPITGLTVSDITNVGTAQNCDISVTGTQPGTSFAVTVTNCGGGTVVLRLASNSVSDAAGNTGPTSGGASVNTVVTTIGSMGSTIYSALHPNGTRLYVPNGSSNVRVMDTSNNSQVALIAVGSAPYGAAVTPNGSFLYVGNYGSGTVSKIATSTNTVVSTITVGSNPMGVVATPDGNRIIVANYSSSSLSVIDVASNAVTNVPLGFAPWNLVLSPDGNTAYAGLMNSSAVAVVNLLTNTVTTRIPVGSSPYEVGINRAGTRVYAANYGSNTVSVIDTTSNTVIQTVAGFSNPMGIAVSMDDETVYVADYSAARVRWFSASTYVVNASTMAVGGNPRGISISPDGSRAYVSNTGGQSLTIFNAAAMVQSTSVTVDQAPPTASFTTIPAAPLSPSSATYTVTFSKAISGLLASDFSNVGSSLTCVFTPASSSGTVINVTVTGCGDGTLELELAANSVSDSAGNAGPVNAVTAPSRYVDAVPGPPSLSFTQNPASPNSSATLTFTLTANERVSGLTADDIINIGTAQGCEYSISGTQPGTTLQVNATSCGDGTVQLRLVNGAVVDGAGNAGPASAGTANTLIQHVANVTTNMYSAAHPDGTRLYIAAQGGTQVRVMNTTTNTVTTNISVGSNPRGIGVTPNGEFVYVANYSSNTVSKISTATNTVVRTISVGASPLGLAITPDGTKVLVANYSGSTVTIINTATDSAATTISLGRAPWNIKVSPDGRFAYTGNVNNNTISVINLQTNTATAHINVGANPYELGINRSGTRVYSANFSSNSVSVIDTSNNTVIRTITGITQPMGIMTSVDDRTVYVVSYGSQRVRWFDANSYVLSSGQIVVQSAAWGLAMSPDGAKGYVSNYSSSSVTVFAAEGFVQSASIEFDRNAPTVTSFISNTNSPNDLTEQTWTLQFSEAVTGLTAADFVVGGTSTGWSDPVVSGTGTTYTVSISHVNPPEGTITLGLLADAISDIAGNTGPAVDTSGTPLSWRVGQGVFKINSLTTSNIRALEVVSQTGDDRGGIALTTDRALLTGDSGMGRFNLADLTGGVRAVSQNSTWMDGIVTDIKTLKSYAFNVNATRTGNLTTLTQLDPLTGLLSSTVVTLSSPIPMANSSMIFAGYSRVAIWTGGVLYDISMPSGQVTNYGVLTIPSRQSSENWASWGVIEYFSGQLHLVYNSNTTTISRMNVATGAVSTVFTNSSGFSDMASFVVNPRSNRWYFHYEGRAGAFNFGSDETLGYADATFNIGGLPPEPITNLSVSTRSSTAVLSWEAPLDGPTPTDYVIQSSTDGGATWRWVNDGVSTSTTASISGFTPGATVRFRVATVSDVNASPYVVSEDSLVSPFATAPTIASVTTANASLSVAFTAPASAGASAINTYQFSLDGGTTWVARSTGTTASPLVITGLTNGTEYSIVIRAINTQGAGEASAPMSGTPTTTPGAPSITQISPSASGTLTVTFDAPISNGGTTITNYQYSLNNGSTWITRNPVSTVSPLVISGLSNGATYNVVLRAVNARGSGSPSASVLSAAGIVALAPTISSVSSGDGTINVVFTPPTYNGGLAISNYEYSIDNGTTWIARTPVSTTSPLAITGLTNGTSYTTQVRAVNAAGSGAASTSRIAAPSRTPDAPTIDSIEPSSQRLRVSVTAPAFDGGVAITNYQYSVNNGSTWVTLSPVNTSGVFSIIGLTNAQPYTVRVRAVNARGSGGASAAVVATPATTPGAPVITSIAPSNQTLSVAFTAGATGGALPTNYEYSLDDGSTWTPASPAVTSSPLVVAGLANGTSYAVRIRAVNSQGAGSSSAASDGTPATVPSAPTIDAITGANGRISIAITNGFDGGAAITNYQYSTDSGTTWTTRTPASALSPLVVGGLTNAVDYNVRVRAVNSQGAGTDSSVVVGRPVTVADAPTISSIAGSPGTLTIAFTSPSFDGGEAVTNYEYSTDGGSTWSTRSPVSVMSPLVVGDLTDGTTYAVRIRAVNGQGSGVSSAVVEGTPENAPGVPTITSVVSANQSVRIAFTAAAPRGLVVTNYQYSIDDGATWLTRSPVSVSSPLTIDGLSNGTQYPIRLRGVNARGAGLESDAVTGIPSVPPGAPTITSVNAGAASGSLDVAFTSGTTGGSAITETQYSLDGGTSWIAANQTTSPATITGLTNGVSYAVKLRHVNLRGAGVASASLSGVPTSTPGAPTLVSVRGSDGTITAFATPPTNVGGTPITNYEYFVDFGSNGKWVALSPASTSMPIVITQFASFDTSDPDDPNPPVLTAPLVNGNTYQVKVRAVNARGAGAESEARSVKPSTTPGAPSINSIASSDSQLSLVFAAPASDGGEAIVNYQYSLDDGSTWTTRSPISADSPLVIGNLTNGTDYTVRLRAVNVQGPGTVSASIVGRPAGAPLAPTVAAIASASGSLSVFFAQGWDNGAAASNVEYSTDGSTWVTRSPASVASPVVIGGLTNGTEYPVRIRLVNSQGAGAASTATNQTPATTPGAPIISSVTSQDASLDVTVSAGATGGAEVTSYQYSTDNGETWMSTGSSDTSFTISSLANGTVYPVIVRAVNRMGAGASSSAVNGLPSRVPDAPTISGVTSGDSRITVTFTEGFNGGSATSNVSYSLDGGSTWSLRSTASSASPIVISGLTNGTFYNLRIAMVNIKGRGSASNALAVRSATTPGSPTIDSISSNNRSLTVFVDAPADDGGDDIVNYEYSLDNGASWTQENTVVAEDSFAISGLTNGTTYNVVVRAINGFGAGASSASVQGTPSTTPSMPVIVSTAPGNELIDLEFALGPNGGATITNIEYSIDDGATWTVRSPASLTSPLTITGLQNGVTYPIKVRSINIKGSGVASRTSGTPATAPTAPLLTRVSPLDEGLRVEFESPEDNGGALITNYAYRTNGGAWVALSPATDVSPFDITGLTNGTSYSIEVAAINSQVVLAGGGANAVASNAVTQSPARRPGAPIVNGSTVSDGTINIAFTVPDTGGRTISAVDYSLDGGDSWVTQLAAQSPIAVQGLANGTPYQVKVRARNELGIGTASAATTLIPARAPFAPTVQSIVRGDTTLTVAYQLGATGGSAISDVEYSIDGGTSWLQQSTPSAVSPLRISTLTNGTEYTLKVRAVNVQGSGDASVSSTGIPIGVPGAPAITSITSGNQSASVAFTLGAANGGVTSNVQYSIDNGTTWTTRSPSSVVSPLAITGLTNGSTYSVRLRSVNEMGVSASSFSSSVTPATTPSAPTVTSAVGEDTRISLAFAPNSDGGNAITNYSYSIDNGTTWVTRSPASTTGPLVVTGLANGTTYTVQLKAINNVGESSASTSVNVMPSGPPTAPTISAVTGSNEALSIAFIAGSNGGAPITAYEVSTDNGFTWTRQQVVASPLTVTGLVNGAAYSVAIRAVNSRGVGTESNVVQGIPATIPDAPQITEVTSDDGAVHVAFAYGNTGGSAVNNVEYSLDNGQTWIARSPASTSRPLTITGLTNGITYDVRLRSVNQIGSSLASDVVDALPATTPGQPTITSLQSGNAMLDVHFDVPQSNGGAPITYYQYSFDGGATWADSVSTVSPIEITGLTVGTEYTVELRAVNLRGPGPVTSAATAKRVTAPPAPPMITDMETGDGFVSLRYVPPVDTGGTSLDRYYFTLDGGNTWTLITNSVQANSMNFAASMTLGARSVYALTSATTQSLTVTGLTNGTNYNVAVRGAHPEAIGLPSAPRTVAPSTTPDEVQDFSVRSLDQGVEISFDSPIDDGGSSITGYEYSLDDGSTWLDVPENPFIVNGLINGTTYNVRLRAMNSNGEGVVSSLSAKPATTASVPTNVRAVAGELSAQLSWDAPASDGGAPITDYIIEYSTDNSSTWSTLNDGVSNLRSLQISSLMSGMNYVFRVTPVNIAGRGATSIASNAVTPTAPPKPIAESPIKPVVIPVVEQKPVTPVRTPRPISPVTTPSVVERLPLSGGVGVAPGEAVTLINGMPRVVNVVLEESGAAVIESLGELLIRVIPRDEAGEIVSSNSSGQLQAMRGRTIEFSGQGFAPNSTVEAWINSTPVLLGEVNTDDTGSFTAEFELPVGVKAGAHTLTLKGLGENAEELVTSLGLNVIEDDVDNAPDNSPDTGSDEADESTSDDGGLPVGPLGAVVLLLVALAGYIALRNLKGRYLG
jgi:YVTN family beta-propeller protein